MFIFIQAFLGLTFLASGVAAYVMFKDDEGNGAFAVVPIAVSLFSALAFWGFVFTFYIR